MFQHLLPVLIAIVAVGTSYPLSLSGPQPLAVQTILTIFPVVGRAPVFALGIHAVLASVSGWEIRDGLRGHNVQHRRSYIAYLISFGEIAY